MVRKPNLATVDVYKRQVQKMMEKDRKVKEIIDDTIKNIRDR